MNKIFFAFLAFTVSVFLSAQNWKFINQGGKCGDDISWEFDGTTLFIRNVQKKHELVYMDNYDMEKGKTPWKKLKDDIRRVIIGIGIANVGSCAFAECSNIQDVRFEGSDLSKIGWGAFYKCSRIRNISLPPFVSDIETLAFANCTGLVSIKIPGGATVGDMAFVNCSGLQSVDIAKNVVLKDYVFATEVFDGDKVGYKMYQQELKSIPSDVNIGNCEYFGLSKESVSKINSRGATQSQEELFTSKVDSLIPAAKYQHYEIYALIIGNENYRYAPTVPFALHDANIFRQYCELTIGIPSQQIHIVENASKQMILEQELEDWLGIIQNPEQKKLIVYYCGHGVPDLGDNNKAYLLPVDVRGSNPKRGISLDDFYGKIADLGFEQTTVFLDACFSGVRNNKAVFEGTREVEIKSKPGVIPDKRMIVFSAARRDEVAQSYTKQGHGLFTYYLLKALMDTQGNVSLGKLADYINESVVNRSLKFDTHKQQTPEVNTSSSIVDKWRRWTLWSSQF